MNPLIIEDTHPVAQVGFVAQTGHACCKCRMLKAAPGCDECPACIALASRIAEIDKFFLGAV